MFSLAKIKCGIVYAWRFQMQHSRCEVRRTMVLANVREQSIAFCKSHVPIVIAGLAWAALLACPPSRPLALSV